MNRGRLIALALGAVAIGGAIWSLGPTTSSRDRVEKVERPHLALLTSLPLLFDDQFSIAPPANAAVARLEQDFTLVPIATADRASLAPFAQLLMAHPRAQPAETLVELDRWVRAGGKVAVLADPMLKWEGSRPPGDRLRPPPDFADTGLLAHWGVRMGVDGAGDGGLRATTARCSVADDGLTARCEVGRGRAYIFADADFMMVNDVESSRRLELVMSELNGRDSH